MDPRSDRLLNLARRIATPPAWHLVAVAVGVALAWTLLELGVDERLVGACGFGSIATLIAGRDYAVNRTVGSISNVCLTIAGLAIAITAAGGCGPD